MRSLQKKIMLIVLMLSAFFCLFNETLLSVGDDVVMQEWKLAYTTVEWTMTIFLVAMSISVPLAAFVIRRWSTKLILMIALGLISLGLLIDACSPNFAVLLIGRTVEGLGAGFITPLLFTSVMKLVSPQKRGIATALCGITCGLGPSFAPTYSGWILNNHFNWHTIFVAPLVICLLLCLITPLTVYDISPHIKFVLDPLSIVESITGFPFLIVGIDLIATSLISVIGWVCAGIGLIICSFWAYRQYSISQNYSDQKTSSNTHTVPVLPLIHLPALINKIVGPAMLIIMCLQVANMDLSVVYPMAVQPAFRLNSLQASLMLMVPLLISQFCAIFSGRLFDRFKSLYIIFSGFLLLIIGFLLFAINRHINSAGLTIVICAALCTFIGVSLITPAVEAITFSAVAERFIADVSTGIQTMMQIGGAIGTAVTMSIFQISLASEPTQKDYLVAFGNISWVMIILYIGCFFMIWKVWKSTSFTAKHLIVKE